MGSIGLGATAKLYVTSGNVLVSNCRDLTLHMEVGESDCSPRDNDGWKGILAGWTDARVDFEMVWDTNDSNMILFRQAFIEGSEIVCSVMDDVIGASGTEGLVASFVVSKFERKEPLAEAIMVEISLKPGIAQTPVWTVI